MLEIVRCICFLFVDRTLLKVTETEFREFNLQLEAVSQVLRVLFAWSAILWTIVFAYRQVDARLEITAKLNEKLSKLQRKLVKGFQIRMDEKEFKKAN